MLQQRSPCPLQELTCMVSSMRTAVPELATEPNVPSTPAAPRPALTGVPFHYMQTDSFVGLLRQLNASLLVTTYQANKLLVAREDNGGLSTLVRTFERPMGLAVDARQLALCARERICLFRNAPDIAPRLEQAGRHDACFMSRTCHVTGEIAGSVVGFEGAGQWVIR